MGTAKGLIIKTMHLSSVSFGLAICAAPLSFQFQQFGFCDFTLVFCCFCLDQQFGSSLTGQNLTSVLNNPLEVDGYWVMSTADSDSTNISATDIILSFFLPLPRFGVFFSRKSS